MPGPGGTSAAAQDHARRPARRTANVRPISAIADACPYAGALPRVEDCPGFVAAGFTPLTTHFEPLARILTCEHLAAGQVPARRGAFYRRCTLGDAAARAAWRDRVGDERVARLQRVVLDLQVVLGDRIAPLWPAKVRQVEASGDERLRATVALERAAATLVVALGEFLESRAADLAAAGVDAEACTDLTRRLVEMFVAAPRAEPPVATPQMLAGFPPEFREFFQPRAAAAV